jgi:hypothetical protein
MFRIEVLILKLQNNNSELKLQGSNKNDYLKFKWKKFRVEI